MAGRYTEFVATLVTPDLAQKIDATARREGLSISAHVRRILTKWHDPDTETVRQVMVDPGVSYTTEADQ